MKRTNPEQGRTTHVNKAMDTIAAVAAVINRGATPGRYGADNGGGEQE